MYKEVGRTGQGQITVLSEVVSLLYLTLPYLTLPYPTLGAHYFLLQSKLEGGGLKGDFVRTPTTVCMAAACCSPVQPVSRWGSNE
jgi:hypothetical protein